MRGRKLSVVVLSASLALAMAACGNDDKTTTTSGAQTGATTATTAAAVTTPTTVAPKPTVATASTSLGTVFVDASGKTLYVWDRDTGPTSGCTGNCAATWPALVLPTGVTAPVAGAGITNLTVAARPDDATKMQVVWNGKPLYTYAADTAPGDTKGDGVGGIWHAAKPA
jgi:predicted lipoprotein with Yx(FWY)xxD motif